MAPDVMPDADIQPIIGSASFFGLLTDVGIRTDDVELVERSVPHLRVAYQRGQRVTSGWPQLVLRLLAGASRVTGDPVVGLSQAEEALDHAQRDGLLVEQALVRIEMARSHAVLGQHAKADDERAAASALVATHRLEGLAADLESPLDAAPER
jgi:hypothetical protein